MNNPGMDLDFIRKQKMKPKILFVLHYPPPLHGSAVVGGYIKYSTLINTSFNCRYINLSTSNSIEEIGHFNIKKLKRFWSLILDLKKELFMFRPNICYMTPTAKGAGFYKDLLLITIIKIFRVKKIYHFHNKGFSERQHNYLYNLLYMTIGND